MPRAERRKRENTKLLITSAKKIPKIYSFFKSKCSEAEDDSGVNVTTAQCICEPTSKTTASATVTVSESEMSSTYDVDRNGDSSTFPEVLAAVSPTPTPANSDDQTSAEFSPIISNEMSATTDTLSGCLHPCCSEINKKPFHPTEDDIKRISVRQYTGEGKSLRERTCPPSIFTKYMWATYCMTKGTIACFFCKKAKQYNLITFSNNREEAFFSGEFGNWKKCQEKLKKHLQSKFHL